MLHAYSNDHFRPSTNHKPTPSLYSVIYLGQAAAVAVPPALHRPLHDSQHCEAHHVSPSSRHRSCPHSFSRARLTKRNHHHKQFVTINAGIINVEQQQQQQPVCTPCYASLQYMGKLGLAAA